LKIVDRWEFVELMTVMWWWKVRGQLLWWAGKLRAIGIGDGQTVTVKEVMC